jgi:hypothetical protein
MPRRLLSAAFFILLCSSIVQATPILYRIDYTLLTGGPAPLPTLFTFDPATSLFTGMSVLWPTLPSSISFNFISNGSGFSINGSTPAVREALLASFVSGGPWSMSDSATVGDSFISLNGVSFTNLSISNFRNDFASGTFTTTVVPEPPSIVLSLAGGLILIVLGFFVRALQ